MKIDANFREDLLAFVISVIIWHAESQFYATFVLDFPYESATL